MSNDLAFAAIPVNQLSPGDHLVDPRVPMDNCVQHVRVARGGTVVVITRKRDRGVTGVTYTGPGYALCFRRDTVTEVWYRG